MRPVVSSVSRAGKDPSRQRRRWGKALLRHGRWASLSGAGNTARRGETRAPVLALPRPGRPPWGPGHLWLWHKLGFKTQISPPSSTHSLLEPQDPETFSSCLVTGRGCTWSCCALQSGEHSPGGPHVLLRVRPLQPSCSALKTTVVPWPAASPAPQAVSPAPQES